MERLKSRAFSAVRWATVASLVKTSLQFLQVVVLARLLGPSQFGMMAIVMAYVLFLAGVSDLGLSNAVVHYRDADPQELSSLYWINLISGTAFAVLLMMLSIPIGWLYHNPALTPLLCVTSASFIMTASCQQLKSRAEKDLRFSEISFVEVVSALLGFFAAVLLAWYTKSVWAMVAGVLVTSSAQSMLSWKLLAQGWVPQTQLSWNKCQRFIRFGGYAVLGNLVGSAAIQADIFVGGRMLGSMELGSYSLSRDLSLRLASVINPILSRVGLPIIASDHVNIEFVANVYTKMLAVVAAFNFPLYLFVFAFSYDVILVVFGERWLPSVELLRITSIWGMVRCVMNPVGSLLYACGRYTASLKWNVAFVVLTVPALIVGAMFGVKGIACSQLGIMLVAFIPFWRLLVFPSTKISLRRYVGIFVTPLVLGVCAVSIAYFVTGHMGSGLQRLVVAGAVSSIVYLVLSYRFNLEWFDSLRQAARWKAV